MSSPKVRGLIEKSHCPIGLHQKKGQIPSDLPRADAAISWLYSQLLLEEDINKYPAGILNMHGGKLPEYRGASVLQWAIANGETELGITWHQILGAVDSGPIWAETTIPIPADAGALEMREAMIKEGLRLFPQAWKRFTSGQMPIRVIDPSTGKIWSQRRPQDGKIGSRWPAKKVRDLIRALPAPWPRPTLEVNGHPFDVIGIESIHSDETVPYTTQEGAILFLKIDLRKQ